MVFENLPVVFPGAIENHSKIGMRKGEMYVFHSTILEDSGFHC